MAQPTKDYRIVKGFGGNLRILEKMKLNNDDEARDWYWRRWGDDHNARIQRRDHEAWTPVYKAIRK